MLFSMLARMRISVPDRPGSLGRLASAIGTAGGDIAAVDVLESEAGRALDDVTVQVNDLAHLETLTSIVGSLAGMQVVGVRHPVPPVAGHADLQLIEQVFARPERAWHTLVHGAPAALGVDWAALVGYDVDGTFSGVIIAGDLAPAEGLTLSAPLRLAAFSLPGSTGAVLIPLGDSTAGLLLVRTSGPEFHHGELWRLGQLGHILGLAMPVAAV